MSKFTMFQYKIKNIGGVWASNDVYFMQTRDSYSAAYKPCYPKSSPRDMIIQTIDRTGAYKRGNYELIRRDEKNDRWFSEYFDNLEQVRIELGIARATGIAILRDLC